MKEAQDSRMKLIVSDGVFSMDGNVAPLKEIGALADAYGVRVYSSFIKSNARCNFAASFT